MNVKQYFICPKCLEKVEVKTDIPVVSYSHNIGERDIEIKLIERPNFQVRCVNCDDFMFECDENMVYPVIGLNQKGYETFFCCEGHHTEIDPENCHLNTVYSYPYIDFTIRNIYDENNEAFKEIYRICKDLAEKFKYVTLEIVKNNGAQWMNIESGEIRNCHRIRISTRFYKDESELTDIDKMYGYTMTVDNWSTAKKEFLRYLDVLIEELPLVKFNS